MLFGVAGPTDGETVITLLAALRAADRAFGRRLAGGRTVTALDLDVCCVTLADAAMGAVAVGCPLAPSVAELAVFTVAFLADVSRGAGRRFGAAGVILTREVAFFVAAWA